MAGRFSFKESFASQSATKVQRDNSLTLSKKPSTPQKQVPAPARRSVPTRKDDQITTAGNDFLRAELRDSAKKINKEPFFGPSSANKGYRSHENFYKRELKGRPSSSSQQKESYKTSQDTNLANEVDKTLKWSKDDPRFKTCDSVSEARMAEQTLKRQSSNGKIDKVSFSQKSIINSIETMTRKSANFYFDRQARQAAHETKESVYTRLSSSHKFNSSNYNLQETQKFSRVSMGRLLKPSSIEKQSNFEKTTRSGIWSKEKHGVQTTDELKDMITQGMSKLLLR
jgi:hypothetical protein